MFSKLYLLLLLILYYVPIVSQSHSRQKIFCTFWSTVIFNKKCYYLFPFGSEWSVTSSWGAQWPPQSTFYPIVSKLDNSNNNSGDDGVCSLLRTYWCRGVDQLAPDHLITNWQSQDLNPGLFGLWLPLYTILLSWQITKITVYSGNRDLLTSPLPGIVAGNTVVSERWILSLELINLRGN